MSASRVTTQERPRFDIDGFIREMSEMTEGQANERVADARDLNGQSQQRHSIEAASIWTPPIRTTIASTGSTASASMRSTSSASTRNTTSASTRADQPVAADEQESLPGQPGMNVPAPNTHLRRASLIRTLGASALTGGARFSASAPRIRPLGGLLQQSTRRGLRTASASGRQQLIRELREENKIPAPATSRACRVCFVDAPTRRAVFTACGHSVCRACAEQMSEDAEMEETRLTCPFCRAVTGFVPLFEDPIEGAD